LKQITKLNLLDAAFRVLLFLGLLALAQAVWLFFHWRLW
jgi:hypothetical protein